MGTAIHDRLVAEDAMMNSKPPKGIESISAIADEPRLFDVPSTKFMFVGGTFTVTFLCSAVQYEITEIVGPSQVKAVPKRCVPCL